jgi:ATP-dependent helicase/nuclease subunit B
MLSIVELPSPSERRILLEKFDPTQDTWIVSDITTKTFLQDRLLQKRPVLAEESILRASELWKLLFKKSFPEYKVVTQEFATVLIGEWLKDRGNWAQTPGAAQSAYSHLSYLMPIFAHGSGIEGMKTWFSTNPSAYERWGHWFVECFYLWNQFEKHKITTPSWISAHLMNLDFSKIWGRTLWVDLGLRMLTVETEIFANLSKVVDVQLIQPNPQWIADFKTSMGAYDFLEVLGHSERKAAGKVAEVSSKQELAKFSSPLGEVKGAVGKIREWINSGVRPSDIACVAPQFKEYEFAFRAILKAEGIALSQGERADLSSFPGVHSWLSDLQVAVGNFESGHLEAATYYDSSAVMAYDEFIRIYKLIYDDEDLKRAKKLYDDFQARPQIKREIMTCKEFAAWAVLRWRGSDSSKLIRLLDKFLSDAPEDFLLEAREWLSHLSMVGSINQETLGAEIGGIQVSDLHSSENLQATHIILVGLSAESLRKPRRLGILPKDLWSIQREIGFNLPLIEDVNSEFDARWLLEKGGRNFYLSWPASDWQGSPNSPSLLWLSFADREKRGHATDAPAAVMWDFANTESLKTALERDFEGKARFEAKLPDRLSVSRLEDYLECPFIFAAKKLLRCDDNEFVDLELGHQSSGRFRHKLFEKILEKPLQWQEDELLSLIDETATELNLITGDPDIWAGQKKRTLTLAKRFQESEIELRRQFAQTKTIARELVFEIYFDPTTLEISSNPTEGGVKIRGSIDRIDEDETGRLVVIDYKASDASLTSWTTWANKKTLQLGFYADVVSSGFTTLGKREVIGAFYMNMKDFGKNKGFARKDADGSLFTIGKKKFGLVPEEQEKLFKDLRSTIASTIHNMGAGSYDPVPTDQSTCESCKWNTLCRGRHLL